MYTQKGILEMLSKICDPSAFTDEQNQTYETVVHALEEHDAVLIPTNEETVASDATEYEYKPMQVKTYEQEYKDLKEKYNRNFYTGGQIIKKQLEDVKDDEKPLTFSDLFE